MKLGSRLLYCLAGSSDQARGVRSYWVTTTFIHTLLRSSCRQQVVGEPKLDRFEAVPRTDGRDPDGSDRVVAVVVAGSGQREMAGLLLTE
jgi:hypothetical protein